MKNILLAVAVIATATVFTGCHHHHHHHKVAQPVTNRYIVAGPKHHPPHPVQAPKPAPRPMKAPKPAQRPLPPPIR